VHYRWCARAAQGCEYGILFWGSDPKYKEVFKIQKKKDCEIDV
jgi:hypothetical protein